MRNKKIERQLLGFVALILLIVWIKIDTHDKHIGKYLAEHHCSRVGDTGFDTIYQCGEVELSGSDILKITSN